MLRRHALPVCALSAAALLFAGCSDSDGGGGSSEQSAEGLAGDAERFAKAIVARDTSTAYEYMELSCQEEMSQQEFTAELTVAFEFAKAFGMDMSKATITGVETRNVEGDTGEARVEGDIDGEPLSDSDEFDDFVYQEGRWRTTDCGMGMGEDSEMSFDDEDSSDTTIGGELTPAEEARAERELSGATTAEVGETIDLGDGMSVVVSSISVGQEGSVALGVDVRAENRGEDGYSPTLAIRCSGSTDRGARLGGPRGYEPNEEMPSGSFEEGTVYLTLPQDGCDTPAYLFVEKYLDFDGETAKIRIDDDLVEELG